MLHHYVIVPSLTIALAISLSMPRDACAQNPAGFAIGGAEASEGGAPTQRTRVYARIILPMKESSNEAHLPMESWIIKKLRKRGETQLRAVTNWVRLAEEGENEALVWVATVDGKGWGCPVSGRIAERTADGMVKVDLNGWSPGGAEIRGGTLADQPGSRTIARVETSGDPDGRAFVALMVGPAEEIDDQVKRNRTEIPWINFTIAKLNKLQSQDKSVLVFCLAEWDVNSKLVERQLFTNQQVIDAVKRFEWVPLRADFTNASEEIDSLFRDVSAMPGEATIVLFRAASPEPPIVLQMKNASELIPVNLLLESLEHRGPAEE